MGSHSGGAPAIGVTVGKFFPPHVGHLHLIREAATRCEVLHVVIGDRSDHWPAAETRAAWLADDAPSNVRFHVTPDDIPETSAAWGQRTLELLGTRPDVAFTSEAYGTAWAEAMGAAHVPIDPTRSVAPVSGRAIRSELTGRFHELVPAARAALARRVAVVGAESSGKTILAQTLARQLGTVWVPEYGRHFWEGRRWTGDDWTTNDFLHIAAQQTAAIASLARHARAGWVIADTDAVSTAVWHRRYLRSDDPRLEAIAAAQEPDMYLLCDIDLPWHQDGARESRDQQGEMHEQFVERLSTASVPWSIVRGTGDDRTSGALSALAGIELSLTPRWASV